MIRSIQNAKKLIRGQHFLGNQLPVHGYYQIANTRARKSPIGFDLNTHKTLLHMQALEEALGYAELKDEAEDMGKRVGIGDTTNDTANPNSMLSLAFMIGRLK